MTDKPIVFADTETTFLLEGRLIELGYATQIAEEHGEIRKVNVVRARPPHPISIEAMAVHHIRDSELVNLPYFVDNPDYPKIKEYLEDAIIVAHNAPFDIEVLEREGIKIENFIDTKRLAMHLVPESPSHSLQYLRYFLDLSLPADRVIIPHSAESDVFVLAALYRRLMWRIEQGLVEGDSAIEKAMELSKTPVLVKICDLKKHAGKTYEEIARTDRGYLEWMLGQDFDEDIKFTVRHWLNYKFL